MLKIVIADDERHVREGLRDLMPWEVLGLRVCGLADCGEAALEMVRNMDPDIVLTDVRMLHMDGIQLGREIRALHPHTRIVFISGYSDAEYLKAALQLAASDYVYKPIKLDEMARVLERVRDDILQERDRSEQVARMEALLEESLPLLREQFLRDWLDGEIGDLADWQATGQRLRMRAFGAYVPVVLAADTLAHEPLSGVMLLKLLRERLPEAMLCPYRGELVALWGCDGDRDDVLSMLEGCRDALHRELHIALSICVGARVTNPMKVPEAISPAVNVLRKRFFAGERSMLFMDTETDDACEKPFTLPPAKLAEATNQLIAGDLAALERLVEGLFERGAHTTAEIDQLRAQCLLLVLSCAAALGERGLIAPVMPLCNQVVECATMAQMSAVVLEYLRSSVDGLRRQGIGSSRAAIRGICEYIRAHPDEHITLDELAERANYAPTYLSMLFKQETGSTISDFVTTCRLEEAMRLLRQSTKAVYQIANEVGYQDAAYFTRLFKRVCGVTPQAYRNRVSP